MKKLMVVFLLGLASCSSSTADDAPIKVAVEYRTTQNQQTGEYFQYPNVRIRAVADQVEIMDLEAFMICKNANIPIRIFKMNNLLDIIDIAHGADLGSLITN